MVEINKIYHEDCLDTLARMADNSVDLVVTSPPYNMRTRIRNGKYTTREKGEHFSKKYKYFPDDLPIDDFYNFHKKVLTELLRVSKIVCYNFQIVTGSKEAFFKIIGDFNTLIKDVIIWDKGHGQPAMHSQVMNSCYEMILVLESNSACGRAIQNAKFSRGEMPNMIRISRGEKVSNIHNATFPLTLPRRLIVAFSSVGQTVYDPFMGSGTTAIACIKEKRNFIGSELDKTYYDLLTKRINFELQQPQLF